MRYQATATTRLPDGRVFKAGDEYYYPAENGEPETLAELATAEVEREEAVQAHLRGEVEKPAKRPRGRPRKEDSQFSL